MIKCAGVRDWKEVKCHGPSPGVRENNGVVEYKGSLYLFGGYNGSQWLNDFHGFHIGEAFFWFYVFVFFFLLSLSFWMFFVLFWMFLFSAVVALRISPFLFSVSVLFENVD